MSTLPIPILSHFCTLEVNLTPPLALGEVNAGQQRVIPIRGGRVTGPAINGTILDMGADWQTIFSSGVAEMNARYAFETDDGALIEIHNFGFRHGAGDVMKRLAAGELTSPDDYYMRSGARLQTGHPAYSWINRTMFVGTGARLPNAVQIDLYAVE